VSFIFTCPHCGMDHSAADTLIGRRVRCPGCDNVVQVTAPATAAAVAESRGASLAVRPAAPAQPAAPATATRFRGGPPTPPPPAEEPVEFSKDKSRVVEGEMDMTPMVDVVFNLLIFFMVTAAFSLQKSIEIPKPQQSDQPSTQVMEIEDNPDFVTIIVDEFNTFQVVTPEWERECPSQQELLIQLREAKDGGGGGVAPTKVLVKAHGDALHERVVVALDSASAVKFEQVQLMTFEEE
jgi:biopolymer transport protein ExbD